MDLEETGIFPTEAVGSAIETFQSGRIAGQNIEAVRAVSEFLKNER